jgi:hypothetical protein
MKSKQPKKELAGKRGGVITGSRVEPKTNPAKRERRKRAQKRARQG